MNEISDISYKDVKDAKVERDVLEKIFMERQLYCDETARDYYFGRKQRIIASMAPNPEEDEKQNAYRFKKGQRELIKLCTQFGHDAPCPKKKNELVECRCCGEKFNYDSLIETYYRKTRFARMILFDYIKNQPFFEKGRVALSYYEE